MRVHAVEVRAATVKVARTIHLVVGRGMGQPLELVVCRRGPTNLRMVYGWF